MSKKVTFTLAADVVAEATAGVLLGEFNNWNIENGISLKKQKDGSMKTTLALEAGKSYQYRYLLNDGRWVNDSTANYAHAYGYQVDNCVVEVPAEEPKPAKVKAVKEVKPAKEKPVKEAKVKVAKEKAPKAAKPAKEKTASTK